jgi:glycosyltransferase involved in cell wall biosynthesis
MSAPDTFQKFLHNPDSRLIPKLGSNFPKEVLRQADSVRVVSSNLVPRVSRLTSAKVRVLPIYVDIKAIEDGPITFDLRSRYNWRFVLLSVTRLAPEKNLGLTLNILARVREQFPQTGLVIVGSGPEENSLKGIARKLGILESVQFVGWQDNLSTFYKTANVFIQTSHFEGYGLSLVEAGLSGLPVITTPVGIANELVAGKDAYIFPAKNPELFVEGIIDLIVNNQKREFLRLNMKSTLKSKLMSKEEYLKEVKLGWEETAGMVSAGTR